MSMFDASIKKKLRMNIVFPTIALSAIAILSWYFQDINMDSIYKLTQKTLPVQKAMSEIQLQSIGVFSQIYLLETVDSKEKLTANKKASDEILADIKQTEEKVNSSSTTYDQVSKRYEDIFMITKKRLDIEETNLQIHNEIESSISGIVTQLGEFSNKVNSIQNEKEKISQRVNSSSKEAISKMEKVESLKSHLMTVRDNLRDILQITGKRIFKARMDSAQSAVKSSLEEVTVLGYENMLANTEELKKLVTESMASRLILFDKPDDSTKIQVENDIQNAIAKIGALG